MPLTETQAKNAKPRERAYKLADSEGLFLLVQPNGKKLWRMKYRFAGKEKLLSFGAYPALGIAAARDKRKAAKALLAEGKDPIKAKGEVTSENGDTFYMVAKRWHENRQSALNPAHAERVWSRMERDVFPSLGQRLIHEITAPEVLETIRRIETRGALDISRRAKQGVGQVFQFAIACGLASSDPTAHLSGALKPRPRVKHMSRLPLVEVPAFLEKLRAYQEEGDRRSAGGPQSYQVYPAGWAWALNSPFPWMKQVASHLGGTRNGMVMSWPGHIDASDQVRPQFSHVVDIAPTIYEATGITPPTVIDGIKQLPLDGISLLYTLRQPGAPTRHTRQYFETLGNRAIFDHGWIASTTPRRMPWEFKDMDGNPAKDYTWELYNLNKDFSQSKNLAAAAQAKLAGMKRLFDKEAQRNHVYPLDDDFGLSRSSAGMRAHADSRTDFVYWGTGVSVPMARGPALAARSFSVTASINLPDDKATGVILASGSWLGGWSFYLDGGRPTLVSSASQYAKDQFVVIADKAVGPGSTIIRYDYRPDKERVFGGGGIAEIRVDGSLIASGRIGKTGFGSLPGGETIDVGRDTGIPVTARYQGWDRFTGEINKIVVSMP